MSTWFDRIRPLDPRVWPYLSPNESLLYRWCLHPGLFFQYKIDDFPMYPMSWKGLVSDPMSRWRVTHVTLTRDRVHNYVHMTREWPCLSWGQTWRLAGFWILGIQITTVGIQITTDGSDVGIQMYVDGSSNNPPTIVGLPVTVHVRKLCSNMS